MPLIHHRPTLTKKAALKMLPYLELLLDQIRTQQPQGMFLSCQEFGGINPHTLQVRYSDALLWLTRHNIDDKVDRRGEFQHLKDSQKNKKEEGGLRIWLMIGPKPITTIRKMDEVISPSDWKKDVEDFLSSDETIKVFDKIILTGEELDWVKRVVGQVCGDMGNVTVSGDKMIISKVA
jgi:hypothetical protein